MSGLCGRNTIRYCVFLFNLWFKDITLVAWNWPQRMYLYSRNEQMLQIRVWSPVPCNIVCTSKIQLYKFKLISIEIYLSSSVTLAPFQVLSSHSCWGGCRIRVWSSQKVLSLPGGLFGESENWSCKGPESRCSRLRKSYNRYLSYSALRPRLRSTQIMHKGMDVAVSPGNVIF